MSDDSTQQYVKVEQHDKRVWFGVRQETLWRVLIALAVGWLGGGKEFVLGDKRGEHDKIVEQRLQRIEKDVSYLRGVISPRGGGQYGENYIDSGGSH